MFPLYKDRKTVKKMILKSTKVIKELKIKKNEIVIVMMAVPSAQVFMLKNF